MNFKLWVSVSSEKQFKILKRKDIIGIVPASFYLSGMCDEVTGLGNEMYVSLPLILRNKDESTVLSLLEKTQGDSNIKGVIVHNTEGLYIIKKAGYNKEIIAGPGMYCWNSEALKIIMCDCNNFSYPLELSKYELKEIGAKDGLLTVYGRTPLMVSANCIRKTGGKCKLKQGALDKSDSFVYIRDRKNNLLPVSIQCNYCYNIVYNAIPTSLHEYIMKDVSYTENLLLSFSDEDSQTCGEIVDYYADIISGKTPQCPLKDFTKAYYNHGVE